MDLARAQVDVLDFVQQSDQSQQGADNSAGAGESIPVRKSRKRKKVLKGPPSKFNPSLTIGRTMDQPTEDIRVSGERARRAAVVIGECSRLGLWAEARSVYDFAAAPRAEAGGAFSSLCLSLIQKEVLSLLSERQGQLQLQSSAQQLKG